MKYTFIVLLILSCYFLKAQTYLSPELKEKEEKHLTEKNAQKDLHSVEFSKDNNLAIEEIKTSFDLNLLMDAFEYEDVYAINAQNLYSPSELANFSQEAKIDFEKSYFAISKDLKVFYRVDKSDLTKFSIAPLLIEGNLIKIKDCIECQDHIFTIENLDETSLVLTFLPQDETDYFVYKLILRRR